MRQCTLTAASLRGVTMTQAMGTGLHGPGAVFAEARLTDCVFDEGNLAGADFSRARLDGPVFSDTDLSGADFRGAVITGYSDFDGANVAGVDFRGATLPEGCLDDAEGGDEARFE